jgi:phosphopantothenoylcysteine decarboxylase/phosphopantothenate--cysteine ligase
VVTEQSADVPALGVRRLLYVGSGALSVAHTPLWVNWLRAGYPELELRVAVTRSAERFVSRGGLAPLVGGEVLLDVWPDEPVHIAPHVELAEWAQAVVVTPASMNFMARLAQGMADTPVMLALQCTRAPVVLAPSLPPGCLDSVPYAQHLAALAERSNITVVPPVPGVSSTTGRMDAALAAPVPQLLTALERLRLAMEPAA